MATDEQFDALRQQLTRDGYLLVPEAIDPEALYKLRDRVALFYRGWDRYPPATRKEIPAPVGEYRPVREINWPAAALRLLDDEPAVVAIRKLVDALARARCHLIHSNSLLKEARNGAPVAPHQDTAYNIHALNTPLTAWIPFDEVDEASGALFYLPGSHKLGALPHRSANSVHWLTDEQVRQTGISAVPYTGRPGSIGIHDSRLVHGSYANRSPRDRLALSLRFAIID